MVAPTLSDLPPEVLLNCLVFTSEVSTIVSSRTWSRHFHAFFEANSEPLFALLANYKGFTRFHSAGDASQDSPKLDATTALGPALQQAIEAQNSGLGSFDECATWASFVKLKTICEANWRSGKYSLSEIYYGRPVWRFKVDTPKKLLLASSAFGLLRSVELSDLPRGPSKAPLASWSHPCPDFSHIELTNGHLIYIDEREAFQIFRVKPGNSGLDHVRRIVIRPGQWLRYLKARWPYLVSGNTRYIAVWNIDTGELVQEVDLPTPQQVAYVDISRDYIFLSCRSGLKLISRTSGRIAHELPPPIARLSVAVGQSQDLTHEPGYESSDEDVDAELEFRGAPSRASLLDLHRSFHEWPPSEHLQTVVASHFDPSEGVLVALFEENMFMLSSLKNPAATVFAWIPDYVCSQLSVENGRAVIIVEGKTSPEQTLLVVHFQSFETCEDFMSNPATVRIMDPVMPCLAPVSRIETDSTAIYVTSSKLEHPQSEQRRLLREWYSESKYHTKLGWAWHTPDGQKKDMFLEQKELSSTMFKPYRGADYLMSVNPDAFSDCVLVYRFDDSTEGEGMYE